MRSFHFLIYTLALVGCVTQSPTETASPITAPLPPTSAATTGQDISLISNFAESEKQDIALARTITRANAANDGLLSWRQQDLAHLIYVLRRADYTFATPDVRIQVLEDLQSLKTKRVRDYLERVVDDAPPANRPMLWRFIATLASIDDRKSADRFYLQALQTSGGVPSHRLRYGFDLGENGKIKESVQEIRTAGQDATKLGDTITQARGYGWMGEYTTSKGLHKPKQRAIEVRYLNGALNVVDDSAPVDFRADLNYERGMIALWDKDYVLSQYFENAITLYTEAGNESRTAWSQYHMAGFLSFYKETEKAKKILQVALPTFEKLDDNRGLARVQYRIGDMYRSDGNLDAAEKHYRIALKHAEKVERQRSMSNIYLDFSQFLTEIGKNEEAAKWSIISRR